MEDGKQGKDDSSDLKAKLEEKDIELKKQIEDNSK